MAGWRGPIWASAEQVIRPEVDAPRWLDQALSLGVSHFSGPMSLGAQRVLIADERASSRPEWATELPTTWRPLVRARAVSKKRSSQRGLYARQTAGNTVAR